MRREAPPSHEASLGGPGPKASSAQSGGLSGLGGKVVLFVLVVALSASAAVSLNAASPEPSRLLVGELELADADEGPGERVSGTFVGSNLAPGDRVEERLTIFRKPPLEPLGSVVEPAITVRFEATTTDGPLAENLLVERLSYGGEELVGSVEDACGDPVTLQVLFDCTRTPPHPMHGLRDPTPEGRDLWLGLLMEEAAEGTVGFDVNITLHGQTVEKVAGPTASPGRGSGGASAAEDRSVLEALMEGEALVLAPGACRALTLGGGVVTWEAHAPSWSSMASGSGITDGEEGARVFLEAGFGALCAPGG